MKDYTAIFFISAIDDFVFLSLLLKDILVLNDAKASRVPDEKKELPVLYCIRQTWLFLGKKTQYNYKL